MGWTEYRATHYKNGKIDRKAECDSYFSENYEVLRSTVKSSVYYAAIKNKKTENVFAMVMLTSVNGMWFAYKDMDEGMEPYYYDCPESILKLLSDTDDKGSLEWRRKCREKAKEPKLSDLPVGTDIIWTLPDGTEKVLTKHEPSYQFKRPFWFDSGSFTYVPKTRINKWKVCQEV